MKITIKDSDKDYHVFRGENIKFYQDGITCEVVSYDGEKRTTLGYFTNIKWARFTESEDQPQEVAAPQVEEKEEKVDKFTQKDLEIRDPLEEKVDFNLLKEDTPIAGVEEQKRGAKKKPKAP